MTKIVNTHEAKTHLSRLLDEVAAQSPRKPGALKGFVSEHFFEPLPEAELAAWER